ncbi:MAG: hypothetical protein ACYCU0_13610, partial [Solirubrobacteraceae bacterium]
AYLYAWTLMLAGLALALRFVPYSNHHGSYNEGWLLVMILIGLVVAAASVYLVYVLEILKFKRVAAARLHRLRPEASDAEIERDVIRDFETGEMEALIPPERDDDPIERSAGAEQLRAHAPSAEQSRAAASHKGSLPRPEIGG